jgi:hypothetical protein
VISEFAVKTVPEKFKMAIEKEAIFMMRLAIDLEYTPLLTTLNIRCTSYVAENSQTKEQYHVGTITYILYSKNGCLRYLREINFYGNWIWYLYNRVL